MTQRKGAGRPTKYRPEFARMAGVSYRLGATDIEVGELFGVTKDTIHKWQKKYTEFSDSREEAKELADDNVQESLYKMAIGGKVIVTKKAVADPSGAVTKTVVQAELPPSPTAAICWLRNRRRKKWNNQPSVTVETDGGSKKIEINFVKPADSDSK